MMKKAVKICLLLASVMMLAGCTNNDKIADSQVEADEVKADESIQEDVQEESQEESELPEDDKSSSELFKSFLAGETPVFYLAEDGVYDTTNGVLIDDMFYPEDGELIIDYADLDNDTVDELIIGNYYGNFFFDIRDENVVLFYQSEGTAAMAGYANFDGATWLFHADTMHMGRVMFDFDKYEGTNKVDSFNLYDEFWETESDGSDVEHTYTYRDQKISKEEYARLYKEIFGSDYQ